MRLAIHAPNLGLSLPDQPFGKDVANRGLYTALQLEALVGASAADSRRSQSSAAVQHFFRSVQQPGQYGQPCLLNLKAILMAIRLTAVG